MKYAFDLIKSNKNIHMLQLNRINDKIHFFLKKNVMLKRTPIIAVLIISLFLSSCAEKEGPAEKAGKKVDETFQNVKDKSKDLGDDLSDKVDDIKDNAKDKMDDLKDDAEDKIDDLKEDAEELVEDLDDN